MKKNVQTLRAGSKPMAKQTAFATPARRPTKYESAYYSTLVSFPIVGKYSPIYAPPPHRSKKS